MPNLVTFGVMKGNYDYVAPFYDFLSRLVFQKAILQAHQALVNFVPAGSSILIVGGGTGKILENISRKHFAGLQIVYVDISKKMIFLSRKRDVGANKITFVNKSIYDADLNQQFDIVITPFLFDNFSDDTAKDVFAKINDHLKPGGLWLFADFQINKNSSFWQKLLLKIMYLFFRFFCGIEASRLPCIDSLFTKYDYRLISKSTFFKQFIYSSAFIKAGNA